jgi:hypothetical protein
MDAVWLCPDLPEATEEVVQHAVRAAVDDYVRNGFMDVDADDLTVTFTPAPPLHLIEHKRTLVDMICFALWPHFGPEEEDVEVALSVECEAGSNPARLQAALRALTS